MKQYLLTAICLTAAVSLSAAGTPEALHKTAAPAHPVLKVKTGEVTRMLAPGVFETVRGGMRRIDDRRPSRSMKAPMKVRRNAPSFADPSKYTLFEGFEGWDGEDAEWIPEGWTLQNKVDRADSWTATHGYYDVPAAEGSTCMGAYLTYTDGCDEWLISPAVEVAAGDELDFYAYYSPMYFFSLDNVDWIEYDYIGDRVQVSDFEVLARAEGDEDWTRLFSGAEKYRETSLEDMIYGQLTAPEKHVADISAFAGKKTQFAFRFVGPEGNVVLIDAVSVGKPILEDISYMNPYETLFWGTDGTIERGCFSADMGFLPVNAPLTWTNMSPWDPEANYSWEYSDPNGHGTLTGGDADGLTVTYEPGYGYQENAGMNMHTFPVLTASKEGALDGTFASEFVGFQAGGVPEITFTSGEVLKVGLLPFPLHRDLMTHATVDYEEAGDYNCPIFGHDKNTDRWWLKEYSYQGDEPAEGEYSRLKGILNFIYPAEEPLVVNGAHVMAYGEISPEAEFTLAFYALPDTYEFYGDEEPIAKAVCKSSDVITEYTDRRSDMVLPFKFDTPVTIKATEKNPAYIVMLTGFNSDAVEYFAPKQSYYPNPDEMCHGYLYKENNILDRVGTSMMPIYAIDGEEGPMYNAFAICLEAEYPWLSTECEAIELPDDGTPVEVKLRSFYDASKLAVTVPEGVGYAITGGYPEATLTLTHKADTAVADGDVTVTSPGHSISIPLTEVSGIADITAAGAAAVKGVYDLSGRRIDPAQAKAGVYVIRYSDGTAAKRIIR